MSVRSKFQFGVSGVNQGSSTAASSSSSIFQGKLNVNVVQNSSSSRTNSSAVLLNNPIPMDIDQSHHEVTRPSFLANSRNSNVTNLPKRSKFNIPIDGVDLLGNSFNRTPDQQQQPLLVSQMQNEVFLQKSQIDKEMEKIEREKKLVELQLSVTNLEHLIAEKVRQRQEISDNSNQINPNVRNKPESDDLFAASVAANEDKWHQFRIMPDRSKEQQSKRLQLWLNNYPPSKTKRSSGIGWIAVKYRDKHKKNIEAKKIWDSTKDQKNIRLVHKLATEFNVTGGKWMCHLPTRLIDDVWMKLASALLDGKMGSSVFMIKVSPVEDVDSKVSGGDHVIVIYNSDYKDLNQIMKIESCMRCLGILSVINYKPDIFSTLGIYRNNKWGLKPTIYTSKVVADNKSLVKAEESGSCFNNQFSRPTAKERIGKESKDVVCQYEIKQKIDDEVDCQNNKQTSNNLKTQQIEGQGLRKKKGTKREREKDDHIKDSNSMKKLRLSDCSEKGMIENQNISFSHEKDVDVLDQEEFKSLDKNLTSARHVIESKIEVEDCEDLEEDLDRYEGVDGFAGIEFL